MNLWKISEGEAELLEGETAWPESGVNWLNEALVLADTEEDAIELAAAYESGGAEPDIHYWKGRLLKALKV